jgi:Fe2+ transport system protein B
MNPENHQDHEKMQRLLLENQKLMAENNEILKKMQRNAAVSMWLRIIWFLFIIGLPFVVYFYVIQPYFDALGSSFGTFQEGLQEIPGWKQFYESIRGGAAAGGEVIDGVQGFDGGGSNEVGAPAGATTTDNTEI